MRMSIVRKILNALVGKTARAAKASPGRLIPDDLPSSPVCAFCGKAAIDKRLTTEQESSLQATGCLRSMAHTVGLWECPCGAIGSGAWPPDLDEAADLLLAVVDIENPMNQSSRGIVEGFRESLRRRQYELRGNGFPQNPVPIRCLWIRPII